MRRVFWFAVGVGVTVYVVRRFDALTQRYATAEGIADVARDVGDRFLEIWEDIRDGMAERESELRDALGLEAPPDGGPDRKGGD